MKTKLISFIFVTYFLTVNCFSQDTIFKNNGNYKYFIGIQEPDSNWLKSTYNDSMWQSDSGRIGYGQNDIKAIIPRSTSVYLRIPFTKSNYCNTLCLYTDFNDGFVAYLNGFEIVRVNLGKPGESISYNRITERSHKAYNYRNYFRPLNGYYIDSSLVKECLRDTNILAIQVHNDSTLGSDLSFNCSLIDITNIPYQLFNDFYFRQVIPDSSYFPIININTDAFGIPSDDTAYTAEMSIINNPEGQINKVSDVPTDYNGCISIKMHGSSSSSFPKKSFSIETRDTIGNNNNVSLFGMPKENDWILVSQFTDRSLIRNELAFNLGRKMGHYEPRTRYCLFILNGEFLGLYTLCETIKRDVNRVDITKLSTTDLSDEEISGGYIVKYDDVRNSTSNNVLQIVYPKKDEIQLEQRNYINIFFNDFFTSLRKVPFSDSISGYKSFIDVPSLIDYMIAEELMFNVDAYHKSTFMFKNRDGKLNFGPLWDHDVAFGNFLKFGNSPDNFKWNFSKTSSDNPIRTNEIMRDPVFVHQFQNRWYDLRKTCLNTDSLFLTIDSITNYLTDERKRNFEVWPIMNGQLFTTWVNANHTYEGEIDSLKHWIIRRINWMDDNISKIEIPGTEISNFSQVSENIEVYPNPFSANISIRIIQDNSANYTFTLYDIYGRKIYSFSNSLYGNRNEELVFDHPVLSNLPKGIYIISIMENNHTIYNHKLLKE